MTKESSPTSYSVLNSILQHHLCLDHPQDKREDDGEMDVKTGRKRSYSHPVMRLGARQASGVRVNRSTIESDNKRRPGIMKRNASKYEPLPPQPPDPNSEVKSVTIHRMRTNLEGWTKQFQRIIEKRNHNDSIWKSELDQRDMKINALSGNSSSEHALRLTTERERNELSEKLSAMEGELTEHKLQMEQLQSDSERYQLAYQEMETEKVRWGQEVTFLMEQLGNSEGMRRRLNDQVTELQGQLAIEEQRSKCCVLS